MKSKPITFLQHFYLNHWSSLSQHWSKILIDSQPKCVFYLITCCCACGIWVTDVTGRLVGCCGTNTLGSCSSWSSPLFWSNFWCTFNSCKRLLAEVSWLGFALVGGPETFPSCFSKCCIRAPNEFGFVSSIDHSPSFRKSSLVFTRSGGVIGGDSMLSGSDFTGTYSGLSTVIMSGKGNAVHSLLPSLPRPYTAKPHYFKLSKFEIPFYFEVKLTLLCLTITWC